MKKILMAVSAIFALQNAVAFADAKSEHKGSDKARQISVGNEKAAKSGATSDMKVFKDKENQGKDEEHRQAKAEGDDHKAAGAADEGDQKASKEKKAKKMKKNKNKKLKD